MAHVFTNKVHNDHSVLSKVADFGTSRKRVCDFLLVLSKIGPILLRCRDIRTFARRKPLFLYPTPVPAKILGVFPLE